MGRTAAEIVVDELPEQHERSLLQLIVPLDAQRHVSGFKLPGPPSRWRCCTYAAKRSSTSSLRGWSRLRPYKFEYLISEPRAVAS
jgi:hypothetical protein